MATILETRDIEKIFGRRQVLKGLSMKIEEGEIYLLLGENGAGKSTFFSILAGLVAQNSGSLVYGDGGKSSRIGGFVESPSFFRDLSGWDNVKVSHSLRGIPWNAEAIAECAERLCLSPDDLSRKVNKYSSGMRMKLALLRAFASDASLVILDEPFNGLDPLAMRHFRDTVAYMNAEKGKSFLISSHIISESVRLATRAGILKDGVLFAEMPLSREDESWRNADKLESLYLSTTGGDAACSASN
jgi:ABC-type multidrug transport system ATPase subunit